mmetsp:Transcript_6250/g.12999  ORF Transcript_6250/g.12999 Transcript_6250/m.12999 type:complete len:168 (+) Transcript_6250:146-649(+)
MGNQVCTGGKSEASKQYAIMDPETDRIFSFRLRSTHGKDLKTKELIIEALVNGTWEKQEASFAMPGFRQYLVSLVVCQHFYLIANAKEREIPVQEVEGEVTITTGKDWIMKQFAGTFTLGLDPAVSAANATPDALKYCQERMALCPVSKNLPAGTHKKITVCVKGEE